MSDTTPGPDPTRPSTKSHPFGNEIAMDESGFSFQPILDLGLEIDGSVYMYSEEGNLEIYLIGGGLDDGLSIADLNDKLTAEVMEHVGEFELMDAGTDTIQGISGFLNKIHFSTGEEEGLGRALICSPLINQFFFCLVIASTEFWNLEGRQLFDALKSHIQFQSLSKPDLIEKSADQHPDLTIETYESITPDEDFLLTIEKGDVSLLLAARSTAPGDPISITEITAPDGKQLYHFNPESGEFSSMLYDQPLMGEFGEVCFFYPRTSQQSLIPGDYRFSFTTSSGNSIQEAQIIIRSGRALGPQMIDFNFWLAVDNASLLEHTALEQFGSDIRQALWEQLNPLNIAPGRIALIQPAPDELSSFSSINIDTDLPDCSYMISESVNNERALNIGLVDEILQGSPPIPAEVNAISSGSPGMIMTTASPSACVLIKWGAFEDDLTRLAKAIIQQLVIFSGIDTRDMQKDDQSQVLILNKDVAWRLRRHPLFYDGG